jgi:hypothetical protein
MTPDDTPVPGDDAIARAARDGLRRLAGSHAPTRLNWTAVALRARRARRRRLAVVVAAGAIVLTTGGVAVAATGTARDHVSIAGHGDVPTTTTTTEAPTSTTTTTTTSLQKQPQDSSPKIALPPANPPQPAQPGDFTGVFQHWRDTCDVCDSSEVDKGITLTIQNITDHPIDISTAAPVRVAVICATGVTADGRLTRPLPPRAIGDIFADGIPPGGGMPTYAAAGTSLAPGAQATNSSATGFTFEGEAPGTATCEGAIVASSDGTWRSETLSVVARLAGFPIYTFQIVDPPTTTTAEETTSTTSETTTSTSTTLP